jgi:hypothetical protein
MKRLFVSFIVLVFMSLTTVAFAGDGGSAHKQAAKPSSTVHFKPYGFFRTFFTFDTRESSSGTLNLYYYMPKDKLLNEDNDDLNERNSFRFVSLTSRFGCDIFGYQYGSMQVGGKIETDFYCLNGTVATLRLRQAYMTLKWAGLGSRDKNSALLLIGQAWHPMAADGPNAINLENGVPFNPFNRSPQVMMNYSFGRNLTFTGGFIYQMQYTSMGPSGKSADYMKYACTPEGYLGLTYKSGIGLTVKGGTDILSIKPRWEGTSGTNKINVGDRITTATPFVYLQYDHNLFQIKAKSVYASSGEHMNLLSGYGVSKIKADGDWEYTPMRSSVSFISARYGAKWQIMGMLGYIKNLGTAKALYSDGDVSGDASKAGLTGSEYYFFNKSGYSNMNSMWRFTPTVAYNAGKLILALEYAHTAVQYGTYKASGYVNSKNGLADDGLHWVHNNRMQFVVKYIF